MQLAGRDKGRPNPFSKPRMNEPSGHLAQEAMTLLGEITTDQSALRLETAVCQTSL
jgi:hypothetical protein